MNSKLRIGWVERTQRREEKCHRPSAIWVAYMPPGGHYSGREMPSFIIFFCKVEPLLARSQATLKCFDVGTARSQAQQPAQFVLFGYTLYGVATRSGCLP